MHISRLDTLTNRELKVSRCRTFAVKERNIYKTKQADFLLNQISEIKTIIRKPQWKIN